MQDLGIFGKMGNPVSLESILEEQLKAYPDFALQDLYQLLYSGVFGVFNVSWKEKRTSFLLEFSNADPDESQRMIERISDIFPLCRINLRSYRARGGDRDVLFEWFGRSTRIRVGSAKDFFSQWKKFERINNEKNYFQKEAVAEARKKFMEHYSRNRSLPVSEHSEQYRKAYNPSYIVVNFQAMIESLRQALLY